MVKIVSQWWALSSLLPLPMGLGGLVFPLGLPKGVSTYNIDQCTHYTIPRSNKADP